jgi:flagellar motility protein MotE (MotC chaperone)
MNNFHSSEGIRNEDFKMRLLDLRNTKLSIPEASTHISQFKHQLKVRSNKNLPNISQNSSFQADVSAQPSPNKSKISSFKKPKMKGYVFLRKNNAKMLSDSAVSLNGKEEFNKSNNDSLKNDPDTSQNLGSDRYKQLTEENNRLIEQIMMDRKRQYSCTIEMNNAFKSKFKLLNKKPRRKLMKINAKGKSFKQMAIKSQVKEAKKLSMDFTKTNEVHTSEASTKSTKKLNNLKNVRVDANFKQLFLEKEIQKVDSHLNVVNGVNSGEFEELSKRDVIREAKTPLIRSPKMPNQK